VSVVICLIAAFTYLRYADKIYNITAKILLQDENKAAGELSGLAELAGLAGGSPASAFVLDQIDVMKSRRIFRKVVDQNKLNISYLIKGNVKSSEVTEAQSPIRLVILDQNSSKLDSVLFSLVVKKTTNGF